MKTIKLICLLLVITNGVAIAQTKDSANKERAFQLTFVTPVSTNGLEAHKITNHVSINILAGVAQGLKGFEVGTLANVILKDVKGAQFAGFANVVLGDVHGAQFAGYANYSGKSFRGAAFAGLCNINLGEVHGGQFAGFCNFNRKGVTGVQVASYFNVALANVKGAQVSAFSNVAVGEVDGAQVSAFVNYAKKVKGYQLGMVNIADTVDGVSIGFFNYVRKGLHQIEASADELFYANLSYRTGTKHFYNVFTAGMKPGSKDNLWHFGYGAGTSLKLKEKWNADLVLTAHHVNTGSFYFGTSELFRAYIGVEYKLAKKMSLAAGPCLNIYVSDTYDDDYTKIYKGIPPYHMSDATSTYGFNTKAWLGAKVALRFF